MPTPKTPTVQKCPVQKRLKFKNAQSKNAYSSKMPSPKTRPRIEKTPDRIPQLDPFHPCMYNPKKGWGLFLSLYCPLQIFALQWLVGAGRLCAHCRFLFFRVVPVQYNTVYILEGRFCYFFEFYASAGCLLFPSRKIFFFWKLWSLKLKLCFSDKKIKFSHIQTTCQCMKEKIEPP